MRLEPATAGKGRQPPLFLSYLLLMPVVVALLSMNFLRYPDFNVVDGSASMLGRQPSVVLRINARDIVVNGLHTSLSALPDALRKVDPPFGSAAMVSATGGTAADLDAVRKVLRASGLATLFVDR